MKKLERAAGGSTGRQLFFDDGAIEHTTLTRTFHRARPYGGNPVLDPQSPVELNDGCRPVACPFGGGVFYDVADGLYKMWYHAGWFDSVGLAVSGDGVHWRRQGIVEGLPGPRQGCFRDGCSVWVDNSRRQGQRYTMFIYFRNKSPGPSRDFSWEETARWEHGMIYVSSDGIHWRHRCNVYHGGDNTSFFYDDRSGQWIFSYRTTKDGVRTRGYCAVDSLEEDIDLSRGLKYWEQASALDRPDPELGYEPQLYKLDAAAYECGYIGVYGIFLGPPNEVCEWEKRPKIIDLKWGFSRDAKNFSRPCHEPFLACSRIPGDSDFGYLHIAGGVCCVAGDRLYLYYGAFSGVSPRLGGDLYAGGGAHLAVLRRDGFVSLDARGEGVLTTRPMSPAERLFMNADASAGDIRAEVVDADGHVIEGYGQKECNPFRGDSTLSVVTWAGKDRLPAGESLRIRFYMTDARIYSYWLTDDPLGASFGYVAAGGPGFDCQRDTVGLRGYESASPTGAKEWGYDERL